MHISSLDGDYCALFSSLFFFLCVRSLTSCPELVCLLEEGEELDGLLALQPEAILLRWFNYHLEKVSMATTLPAGAAAAGAALRLLFAAHAERSVGRFWVFVFLSSSCFPSSLLS